MVRVAEMREVSLEETTQDRPRRAASCGWRRSCWAGVRCCERTWARRTSCHLGRRAFLSATPTPARGGVRSRSDHCASLAGSRLSTMTHRRDLHQRNYCSAPRAAAAARAAMMRCLRLKRRTRGSRRNREADLALLQMCPRLPPQLLCSGAGAGATATLSAPGRVATCWRAA